MPEIPKKKSNREPLAEQLKWLRKNEMGPEWDARFQKLKQDIAEAYPDGDVPGPMRPQIAEVEAKAGMFPEGEQPPQQPPQQPSATPPQQPGPPPGAGGGNPMEAILAMTGGGGGPPQASSGGPPQQMPPRPQGRAPMLAEGGGEGGGGLRAEFEQAVVAVESGEAPPEAVEQIAQKYRAMYGEDGLFKRFVAAAGGGARSG